MADLAPLIRQRFFNANGEPLSGGKLWSYVAGTTTPIQTYTDRSGTSFNTNPIILDSEGYCDVWLGPGYFKFVLMDANDVTIWTKDNVSLTTNSNESLPSGGLANTFLKKNSEVDFDCAWVSLAKSDVGLGNVDNTSDANKPISTATQTALDLKANAADLTAHIDDAVAAHQATAIFYNTNVSFLVADNVQQAIDEVNDIKVDKSSFVAKGDLLSATAASTPARLAVGSNGQVLTADSAESTGLKWASSLTNPMTTQGDLIVGGTSGAATRLAKGSDGDIFKMVLGSPAWSTPTLPTIQRFTSGSGTYTTPTGVKYIKVKMVGGGGGGQGSGTSAAPPTAGAGGNTVFGTSLLVANGGNGGNYPGGGGIASYTINSPAYGIGSYGVPGHPPMNNAALNLFPVAHPGAASPLGGPGNAALGSGGGSAAANTGSGGGGASTTAAGASYISGASGSSGAYIEAIIPNPSASYSYSVGAGGTAGAAQGSGLTGGAGGSGVIIVEEYYQ